MSSSYEIQKNEIDKSMYGIEKSNKSIVIYAVVASIFAIIAICAILFFA